MSWGNARRPKISNKLGIPNSREGSDGDIQVRQTNLGAKLFGKIGGRWNSTFLSSEEEIIGTSGTKIGMDSSGTFTVGALQCSGNIICGKGDGTFNATDNINIGMGSQSGLGIQNICIGRLAGEDITANSTTNTLVGYHAGKNVTGVAVSNVCVGQNAGDALTSADYNICIGAASDGAATLNEQIAIGRNVACDASETIRIGDSTNYLLFDFGSSGGTIVVTSDERVKKNIIDTDIGLEFINALRPIKYVSKNKHDYPGEIFQGGVNTRVEDTSRGEDPSLVQDGFIAQEVKGVMDDMNITFSGWHENNSSRQMLGYSTFVVPLVKAVQELSTKLDTMQTEINNLKAE